MESGMFLLKAMYLKNVCICVMTIYMNYIQVDELACNKEVRENVFENVFEI